MASPATNRREIAIAKLSGIKLNALTAQPLNDWVLVKRIDRKDQGDIIIPDNAKEASDLALVISTGPRAHGLAAGDRVLTGKFGMDIEIEGEKLVMVKAAEVYLRFPDGSAN